MVGAIIMVHGDDQGLRLPPVIAPIQVVIVPIHKGDDEKGVVLKSVAELASELKSAGLRVHVDEREEFTPGWKFNDWEMRGVPLRIEVGPREVAEGKLTCARRDADRKSGKTGVSRSGVVQEVNQLLDQIQESLHDQALTFRDSHIHEPKDYPEFKEIVRDGWAYTWWCGRPDCEATIQEETKATSRNIPLDQEGGKGTCIRCGSEAVERAYFGRAY
jgi:prolyl-tRNA synthetase